MILDLSHTAIEAHSGAQALELLGSGLKVDVVLPVDPASLSIARLAKPRTQRETAAAMHQAVRAPAPNRVALPRAAS